MRIPPLLRGRKGQSDMEGTEEEGSDTLLYLILVVIVAVLLLATVGIAAKAATKSFEDNTCRISVATAAGLQMAKLKFAADIRCPRTDATITATTPEEVDRQIGQAMTGCWHNWWEGRLNYFSDNGVYCHVCSILTFSPKTGAITNLSKYLAATPQRDFNGSMLAYLGTYQTKDIQYVPQTGDARLQDSYPRDQTYAVMFVHARGNDEVAQLLQKTGIAVGGTAAIAGGAYLVIGVGGLLATPVGWGAVVVGGSAILIAGGTGVFDQPAQWTSQVAFVPLREDTVKAFGCQYDPSSKTAT